MAATNGALIHQYQGQSLLLAFNDNASSADLLQIVEPGGLVVVSVSFDGTVNLNPTATLGAGGSGKYTVNRTIDELGQFRTRPTDTVTTVAQAFASAFPTNPQSLDIIQIINQGGNISYYLDSLGVAHGS